MLQTIDYPENGMNKVWNKVQNDEEYLYFNIKFLLYLFDFNSCRLFSWKNSTIGTTMSNEQYIDSGNEGKNNTQ